MLRNITHNLKNLLIAAPNVDFGEVSYTCHLHVIWCLHKVDACQRAIGHCTSSPTGFRAPGNLLAFCVTNGTARIGWSP